MAQWRHDEERMPGESGPERDGFPPTAGKAQTKSGLSGLRRRHRFGACRKTPLTPCKSDWRRRAAPPSVVAEGGYTNMCFYETNPFANVAFYVELSERMEVTRLQRVFANGFVFRESAILWNSEDYAFFPPRTLAMMASTENAPGPKTSTMIAVSMNKNSSAVTKASGLVKMFLILSGSAVK